MGAVVVGLCAAGMGLGIACGDAASGGEQDGGLDADVSVDDARPTVDARPGADARPEGIPYDFCSLPFMKLPIDGQGGEMTVGIHLDSHYVVYLTRPAPYERPMEVRMMDLETCLEYQLTNGSEALMVWNAGDHVYYTDTPREPYTELVRHIYHYDVGTWTERQITNGQFGEIDVRGTEDYLLFKRFDNYDTLPAPKSLILHILATGEERALAPSWASAGYYDVDGHRAVYAGFTDDPQSEGRDVFMHDILQNETHHIDTTYAGNQSWAIIDGNHIAYTVTDRYGAGEGSLMLYHIPTAEEELVSGPEPAGGWAAMDGTLLAYNTNRYQAVPTGFPSDIELFDIDSGVKRRVTAAPSNLRAFYMSFPYLLMIDWLLLEDRTINDYYVAHLVRLGITDEQGHVLPGDGIILPPR